MDSHIQSKILMNLWYHLKLTQLNYNAGIFIPIKYVVLYNVLMLVYLLFGDDEILVKHLMNQVRVLEFDSMDIFLFECCAMV